ncbi:hypothetical protein BGZ83_000292 [Gryganskiella cystojenkinii]|nr:hypothetical protein BGZ83_000292 [Gryganskiella cystojenkinii]
MTSNVLLLGNTGVGKSYLLNSLGGNFQSGFSAVNGLTGGCGFNDVVIETSTLRLIDTPGLLEASGENMIRNANSITQALRMKGRFKIIFVLADRSGRVDPSDLFLIGKVLSAIEFSVDVGLIINKVPEDDMELYLDATTKNDIIQQLNNVANGKIKESWFSVIPRFHRDNLTGAATHLNMLLADMVYQDIAEVHDIAATILEYNQFVELLKSVGKFAPELWNKFQERLKMFARKNDEPDRNVEKGSALAKREVTETRHAEIPKAAETHERQAQQEQPESTDTKIADLKVAATHPPRDATGASEQNPPTLDIRPRAGLSHHSHSAVA